MRKLFVTLGIVLFALFPTLALGAELKTGETRVTVRSDEVIDNDLYIASGEVSVDGTVNGDVVAAGGQIRVTGKVTGDLIAAGGNIDLSGEVGDDIRVAGGNIAISGRVGDDAIIAGGNVEITAEATVAGDVLAGVGTLTISGTTGSVRAGVGDLRIASTAKINGDLRYSSDREATIESGATITGKTTRELIDRGRFADVQRFFGFPIVGLLVALLFFFLFPHKSAVLTTDFRKRFFLNLLIGFLFLIAVPIAAVLLMVSLVGMPLGFGLMLLFPIFLYLGYLAAAIALGTWIKNLLDRAKEPKPTWLAVVLGIVGFSILGLIPFVGWLLGGLVYLAGLGALVRFDREVLRQLRANKTL